MTKKQSSYTTPIPSTSQIYGSVNDLDIFLDIETQGLNAYTHEITCIGIIIEDDKRILVEKYFTGPSEEKILKKFLKLYNSKCSKISATLTWNGNRFDLPFLFMRCLKHGMKFIVTNQEDVKEHFPKFEFDGKWRQPSLGEAAKFLGIDLEEKALFDGKDAVTLAKCGMMEKLGEYCVNDVRLLREIHKKLEEVDNNDS